MVETIQSEVLIEWALSQGCEVVGDYAGPLYKAASLTNATAQCISFCSNENASEAKILIDQTQAAIVLCRPSEFSKKEIAGKMLLLHSNPRLVFLRMVSAFFVSKPTGNIHPRAIIDPEAEIAQNVSIGAGTVIGKAKIGENTVIDANVTIKDGVLIGRNVSIFPGTVIGSDGFGYERNDDGIVEKFPHIGGVTIEDNVEIGSNTCIDRGTLDDTVIRSGAKIDNLVHVAHNVEIGQDCLVIALSMLGGGVKIGERGWIAPGAIISNKIIIGDDALVGLGSVVVKNVEDNHVVLGSPARGQNDFRKLMKFMKSAIAKEAK